MQWTKEMLGEFCRLKYVEGMTLNQIAETMGITKGAARNNGRGRKRTHAKADAGRGGRGVLRDRGAATG